MIWNGRRRTWAKRHYKRISRVDEIMSNIGVGIPTIQGVTQAVSEELANFEIKDEDGFWFTRVP